MKSILFTIFSLCFFTISHSQELNPVTWDYYVESSDENTLLIFEATIENGWYLYSQQLPENGPIPTSFHFDSTSFDLTKYADESTLNSKEVFDEMFQMTLKKYSKKAIFTYSISKAPDVDEITGYLQFMCCDEQQCLAPKTINFNFKL